MDIKDRIRRIMEDRHMTQQVFADFIQQSPGTLSSIFNGRTRPTLNILDAIKKKIPDISIEWLMYGNGDMYVTSSPASSPAVPAAAADSMSEPMIDFEAATPVPSPASSDVATSSHGVKNIRLEQVREEVKKIDKEPRRVVEIRVYYDDQTYETFSPSKR